MDFKSVTGSCTRCLTRVVVAILLTTLAGCATVQRKPPPATVSGDALSLPSIGKTMPISLFARSTTALIATRLDSIRGITTTGAEVPAMTLEKAADAAGGSARLLAALSNETEIARINQVAKAGFTEPTKAGAAAGCFPGLGLLALASEGSGPGAGELGVAGIMLCAAGSAAGAAVGLVGALAAGGYYSVAGDARRMAMLRDIALPEDTPTYPLTGYVFFPPDTYKAVQLVVTDVFSEVPQTIAIPVVVGKLPAPGQPPIKAE